MFCPKGYIDVLTHVLFNQDLIYIKFKCSSVQFIRKGNHLHIRTHLYKINILTYNFFPSEQSACYDKPANI